MTLHVKKQMLDCITLTDIWLISILSHTVLSHTENHEKEK